MNNLRERVLLIASMQLMLILTACGATAPPPQNVAIEPTKPFFPVASFTPLPTATPTPIPTATPNPIPVSISERVTIPTGSLALGMSREEAELAIAECIDRDRGDCKFDIVADAIPVHQVTINTFELDRYEVTYTQYVGFLNYLGAARHVEGCFSRACARTTIEDSAALIQFSGSTYSTVATVYDNVPVTYVTWYGALAYCQAFGLRLPTEAEWEYAARRPDGRIYPWGSNWDETRVLTSKPTMRPNPAAINEFSGDVSADGVSALAGNVSEWINDYYNVRYYLTLAASETTDPAGPTSGTSRVNRGGNFRYGPIFARSTQRQDRDPSQASPVLGFRCARSVK